MIQGRNFLTHFVSFRRSHWLWLKQVKQTIRACPSLSKAKTYFGNAWATSFGFFLSLHVGEVCLTRENAFFHKKLFLVFFCLCQRTNRVNTSMKKFAFKLCLFFSFLICLKEIKFHHLNIASGS